jgi:hypothetical protein
MAGTSAFRNVAGCALTLGLLFAQVATAPAQTAAVPAPALAPAEARPMARYYIEFRVAEIGAYGHSYVVYGALNGRGQPADFHYADLHPMGNYLIMAIGHVLPVPANTEWDPDVLKLPIASSYRHILSAADYQKLLAAVRRARSDKQPYWNAVTNNCNHFVAKLAQSVGLRAPTDFLVSYSYIPALRALNESAEHADSASARKSPSADRGPASTPPTPKS